MSTDDYRLRPHQSTDCAPHQVRHNEEHVHAQMSTELPWRVDQSALDSPHVKAQLLLQAHFARTPLPMSDYVTDTKSVLDQAMRVLQAMVDIAADGGWLDTTLSVMHLVQMVTQARFLDDSPFTDLPHVDDKVEARRPCVQRASLIASLSACLMV